LGKALCNKYYGLSEYTDFLIYQKCIEQNIQIINLGRASKGLLFYKEKFPGTKQVIDYNGTIKSAK